MNIKELKEAALNASDGPWFARGGEVWIGDEDGGDPVHLTTVLPGDAAHIALANPSTILSLIARMERLERAAKEMESFVTIMFAQNRDGSVPDTIPTPLGPHVKLGEIMAHTRAALETPAAEVANADPR